MTSLGEAAETTGDRVLRVATELFAQRGFDATGVQELSDATGLGRGALYYHIKSKNELLARIAIGLLERANAEARVIVEMSSEVEERFRLLSSHLFDDLVENRDAWITSMRDWEALDGSDRERVLELRNEYESFWQCLLDEGTEAGLFIRVHPVLRRALIGMYTSSYRWIQSDGSMSSSEISDTFLRFILRGIRTGD